MFGDERRVPVTVMYGGSRGGFDLLQPGGRRNAAEEKHLHFSITQEPKYREKPESGQVPAALWARQNFEHHGTNLAAQV